MMEGFKWFWAVALVMVFFAPSLWAMVAGAVLVGAAIGVFQTVANERRRLNAERGPK